MGSKQVRDKNNVQDMGPKILENQQIPKKPIFRRWYTQIPISRAHGINKIPKISSGDDLGAELAKFHE